MDLQDVGEVIGGYSGRPRTVLEYSMVVKRLVDEAKKPGFSVESWAPLAELVDVDEFQRVGAFKEVMNWPDYVDFLTNWAMSSEWECSLRRIAETSGVVFLELEERLRMGDVSSVVNSSSVYEFNEAGKIQRVYVYLQMDPPQGDMLKSYEGAAVAE
jgi:hypothetical protein